MLKMFGAGIVYDWAVCRQGSNIENHVRTQFGQTNFKRLDG